MASQLEVGGITVDVVLKEIKNVHLSVHPPTGRVRISAPKRMSLDVLRVFQKHCGHVLRRERARAAILCRLHRIERRLRTTRRFASTREISGFEEVTVKLWRV